MKEKGAIYGEKKLASDMFLNTITNPVKWSCPVCKHVKMATLDRDVNLTCLIFRGMLRVWKKIWGKWRDDISKLHEEFYGTIFIYRVYRPAATNYRAGFFKDIYEYLRYNTRLLTCELSYYIWIGILTSSNRWQPNTYNVQ